MNRLLAPVLLLFLAHVTVGTRCARRVTRPDRAFCARPPVDAVSVGPYLGTWYQLFTNEVALRVSSSLCGTANYTLRTDGGIDVLNCQDRAGAARPLCVRGVARRRPDAGADGRFTVQFGAGPPGAYNVAALLGDREYGYYAAAVFSCQIVAGTPVNSWFIIARNPFKPYRTLWDVAERLRCKGYDVYNERFIKTTHGKGCRYFFGDNAFDVLPPAAFRPPARAP